MEIGTKVAWCEWISEQRHHVVPARCGHGVVMFVETGIVVAQSRQGEDCVIVEWDSQNNDFIPTVENINDLVEI